MPQMAKDLGRLARQAQHMVDELKAELVSEAGDDRTPQRSPEARQERELENGSREHT